MNSRREDAIHVPHGLQFSTPDFGIHFGNKMCTEEALPAQFPNLSLNKIHQVHGTNIVVAEPNSLIEADGHWTTKSMQALCIKTADCMPIFIYTERPQKIICGLHAGWKGLAHRIVPKMLEQLQVQGSFPESWKIFVGPHIGYESFEVDAAVKDEILNSISGNGRHELFRAQDDKFLVDLHHVLLAQLFEFGVTESQVSHLAIDTKSHPEFHSYRREHKSSGRQISLIWLKA